MEYDNGTPSSGMILSMNYLRVATAVSFFAGAASMV